MANYEIKDIVSDYGLYENGELKLICKSRRNALLIKAIMEKDNIINGSKNYFTDYDYVNFMKNTMKRENILGR